MPMINPFTGDAFGLVSLTQAINVIPNKYGRLLTSGIFADKPITTNVVLIERQNHILRMLPSKPVGASGSRSEHGKRNALSFQVPHIPLTDLILPGDFSGVRSFGTENQLDTLMGVMARYQEENHSKFEITWEHGYWGALKGKIIDGDGTTELYDLFSVFGLSQKVIDFALDDDDTDVPSKCRELARHMEDNLLGDVMSGVRVFVSKEFFDELISHPSVKEYYLNHEKASQLVSQDARKGFTFCGVTFEEYNGQASDASGNTRRFIASGEGHAIPEGTMSTFIRAVAPGNFLETVNTMGVPLYMKQVLKDFDRGIDLWLESNVLPLCLRPQLLVKVTM